MGWLVDASAAPGSEYRKRLCVQSYSTLRSSSSLFGTFAGDAGMGASRLAKGLGGLPRCAVGCPGGRRCTSSRRFVRGRLVPQTEGSRGSATLVPSCDLGVCTGRVWRVSREGQESLLGAVVNSSAVSTTPVAKRRTMATWSSISGFPASICAIPALPHPNVTNQQRVQHESMPLTVVSSPGACWRCSGGMSAGGPARRLLPLFSNGVGLEPGSAIHLRGDLDAWVWIRPSIVVSADSCHSGRLAGRFPPPGAGCSRSKNRGPGGFPRSSRKGRS